MAQESGDHRLALLLAQAAGSHIPRQMIQKQLANWEELKVRHCGMSIHFTIRFNKNRVSLRGIYWLYFTDKQLNLKG